jgi:hypothetical protein
MVKIVGDGSDTTDEEVWAQTSISNVNGNGRDEKDESERSRQSKICSALYKGSKELLSWFMKLPF